MPLHRVFTLMLAALGISASAAAQPAKDTLSYELVSATISSTPPRAGFVIVEFGKTIPKRYLSAGNTTLPTGTEWTIETRERTNTANLQTVAETAVFVAAEPGPESDRRAEPCDAAERVDPLWTQGLMPQPQGPTTVVEDGTLNSVIARPRLPTRARQEYTDRHSVKPE